jgi:integrase/recombinase XerD
MENNTPLLEVLRAHLEIFGRTMEANGRMRSTVARRLSTLGSFYRYCHVEGILERIPAANVRRPKVAVESRTLGLDRNELGPSTSTSTNRARSSLERTVNVWTDTPRTEP